MVDSSDGSGIRWTRGAGSPDVLRALDGAPVTVATVAVGSLAGGAASLALVALDLASLPWAGAGALGGGGLAVAVGSRTLGAGRGLTWGLAAAVLVWLLAPLAAAVGPLADPGMSLLPRLVLGVGAPAGFAVGLWQGRTAASPALNLPRASLGGGIAGSVGGAAFGVWMERAGMLPLVADLVGADSATVGGAVHVGIAVTIGVTFGLLFQRDIRGYGSALAWGVTYAVFWWLFGVGTLFPLLSGRPVDWSAAALSARLGTLVGHLVYGLLLGVGYGLFDRLWRVLFYESDPLYRDPVGPGINSLQAARWGVVASLGGGVVFGAVLWRTGQLRSVAALVGADSLAVGAALHMLVGALIGVTYGQLFRYEAPDVGGGAAWGLVYGFVWWILGPLTLLPALLGRPLAWTAPAIAPTLPLLFGHLVYGSVTGAVFSLLERRHRLWAAVNPRVAERERKRRRPLGTAAPATTLTTMGLLVVFVVLLSP